MHLQSDVRFDVLAKEMQHQPRIHKWKGYVRLAGTNVEVASRDIQGIMPAVLIQMDSNHIDASSREV